MEWQEALLGDRSTKHVRLWGNLEMFAHLVTLGIIFIDQLYLVQNVEKSFPNVQKQCKLNYTM